MTDFRADPGPCPICDEPHTTCTSPGYAGTDPRGNVILLGAPLLGQRFELEEKENQSGS